MNAATPTTTIDTTVPSAVRRDVVVGKSRKADFFMVFNARLQRQPPRRLPPEYRPSIDGKPVHVPGAVSDTGRVLGALAQLRGRAQFDYDRVLIPEGNLGYAI